MATHLTVKDAVQILSPLAPFLSIIIRNKDNMSVRFYPDNADYMKEFADKEIFTIFLDVDTNILTLTLKER